MRARFITSTAILAAAARFATQTLPAGAAQGPRPRPPSRAGFTPAQLLTIAERLAKRSGDTHPYDIEAARTTRGAAYRVIWPGAAAGRDHTPVLAITMRGRFTAYWAMIPSDAPLPTGTVISVVIAATGRFRGNTFDANITTRPEPDLARLGR